MILTQPPPTFLLDVTLFTVFFGTRPLDPNGSADLPAVPATISVSDSS